MNTLSYKKINSSNLNSILKNISPHIKKIFIIIQINLIKIKTLTINNKYNKIFLNIAKQKIVLAIDSKSSENIDSYLFLAKLIIYFCFLYDK